LAKEGRKQNIPILRPLLPITEEIHSYLGGTFFASFLWWQRNEEKA